MLRPEIMCWNWFSPSTMWIPRITLRWSGVAACPFTCRASLQPSLQVSVRLLSLEACSTVPTGGELACQCSAVLLSSLLPSTRGFCCSGFLPLLTTDAWCPRLRAAPGRLWVLLFLQALTVGQAPPFSDSTRQPSRRPTWHSSCRMERFDNQGCCPWGPGMIAGSFAYMT